MKVSADKYEFPLIMADTQSELARICGVKRDSVASAIHHARKRNMRCQYVKVVIEEDEQDETISG